MCYASQIDKIFEIFQSMLLPPSKILILSWKRNYNLHSLRQSLFRSSIHEPSCVWVNHGLRLWLLVNIPAKSEFYSSSVSTKIEAETRQPGPVVFIMFQVIFLQMKTISHLIDALCCDLAGLYIGSITSRCSGKEPALLPRKRNDTRERRKSSLACRGGHWGFRFCGFGYFLDRFFGSCAKILRFFGFHVHCGLRIFRFLASGFRFS